MADKYKVYADFGRSVMNFSKQFNMQMKCRLAEYDLNTAEGVVLLCLYEADGITQEAMLNEIHYDKSVLARTLQSLEKKQFVERRENPDDGRSSLVYLTDRAEAFRKVMRDMLKDWSSKAFTGIKTEDIESCQRNIELMIDNAKK
ncbi:MAG: MarR family transcriptional regulator [Eubacteriaceae bacterium]|jgi:DNA-binding MarR family transcriptional regulator|nr:MarR family transcriptional regulator [Eubacteriaceae bacterium]